MRRLFLMVLLTAIFGIPTSTIAAPSKSTLVMGFNPAENVEVYEQNGKKLAEAFKQKTGIDVKIFIATDYTALIEALRSGLVDIAWLPAFSYVKAEEVAKAVVLLKVVRKGHPYVWGTIITRSDRSYTKVEDLRGRNIAWVDPSSSSGHIVPKAELIRKKQLDPEKHFGKQVFAGSHDAVVLSVLNGTVDAGATLANDAKGTDGLWLRFLKPADREKIKVVYVSEPIPGDTVTASRNLATKHPDLVEIVTRTLMEMTRTAEGKKILYSLYQIDALVPAKPAEYESLREAARILKLN
jgi:phosphonate transport system substrate-binding protein